MRNFKNKQGGLVYVIIVIIGALLLMRYMGVTFTGVYNWFRDLLISVY